jgi:hypothetical protein
MTSPSGECSDGVSVWLKYSRIFIVCFLSGFDLLRTRFSWLCSGCEQPLRADILGYGLGFPDTGKFRLSGLLALLGLAVHISFHFGA